MNTKTTWFLLAILLFTISFSAPSNGQKPQNRYSEVLNLWGEEGRDNEIMELINETIEADSAFSPAYLSRGGLKHGMGDMKGSEGDYTKAIHFDPENATYFHARGSLRVEMGNLEGALSDLDRSIELDPNFSSGYYSRSIAREIIEDWQGVIDDCTKLIEMFPPDKFPNYEGTDYFRRGNARFKLDDIKGACMDWTKALEIGYTEALEKIEEHCQ